MYTDSLIFEPIVCSTMINYPELESQSGHSHSEGLRIAHALRALSNLKPDFPRFLFGCAHRIVGPTSAGNGSGSFCNSRDDGGCEGRIVLAPLDQAKRSKWIALSFKLAKGQGDLGWFTLAFNPTTIAAGDNIHPACMPI